MKSYDELNSILSKTLQTQGDLSTLKVQWTKDLEHTSVFIDMFLERFGSRISGEKSDTPEWRLYNAKTEWFNSLTRAIRSVDYFMAKQKWK